MTSDEHSEFLFETVREMDRFVEPWQTLIAPGDYFTTETASGVDLYGEILPRPRNAPDDPDGVLQHFRYSKTYRADRPDGLASYIHVAAIEKLIDERAFARARDTGWLRDLAGQ